MKRHFSRSSFFRIAVFPLLLLAAFAIQPVWAQPPAGDRPSDAATDQPANPADGLPSFEEFGGFQDPGSAGGFGDFGLGDGFAAQELTLSAAFTQAQDGQPARLFITAKMAPQWHLYSMTQPPGAVKATTVKLEPSEQFTIDGKFAPDKAPEVRKVEVFDVPLEEHYGVVTFSAPIRLAPGLDASQLTISGELDGMVCHDERGCRPLSLADTKFEARLATGQAAQDLLAKFSEEEAGAPGGQTTETLVANDPGPSPGTTEYRAEDTHATLRGRISPETVVPGSKATLEITAVSDPGWYVYAYTDTSIKNDISSPTRLLLQEPPGWEITSVGASSLPKEKQEEGFPVVRYHEGIVAWLAEISIPADVPHGQYTVEGLIGYQSCSNQCDRPTAAVFSATIRVGPQPIPGQHELAFRPADQAYRDVAQLADAGREPRDTAVSEVADAVETDPGSADVAIGTEEPAKIDVASAVAAAGTPKKKPKFDPAVAKEGKKEKSEPRSFLEAMLLAFGGGLILNIMPCVLPVIGLKILAFFDQAGQSRSRAFWLNAWYSLGLVSVFIVLAALGIGLSELFTKRAFLVIMSCLVFSMSLSLMGIWELRVPSFLGGSGAQKLMQKEGAVGAVYKGVITTLLAIPCGAPLLSPALTWVEMQVEAGATATVYVAAIMMGLGMAAPYLIIGAFPELLRFMPKPGAWMETFKKAMGYFLLLAVVWILYSVPREDLLATIALMFAIWFLCWLVGRLPITASTKAKAWSWGGGLVVVGLTFMIGFQWLLNPSAKKKIRAAAVAAIDEGEFDDEVKLRITDGEVDNAVMGRFALIQQEDAIRLAAATGNGDPAPPTVNEEVVTPVSVAPDAGEPVEEETSTDEDKSELPWQPFKRARFEALVGESKTILIDFTADWCLTCKALEASVLNTKPIREFVDQNGVITLKADWTRGDPEITEMLEILGGKQVPVIAIFPAGNPNEPLILRGWYTKDSLLEELKKAGPSAGIAAKRRTAMRVP